MPTLNIQPPQLFEARLWQEVNRYKRHKLTTQWITENTVTVTEDNLENLYKSQFEERTSYGEIFRYTEYVQER